MLTVENTTRAGTFFFITTLPAPEAGSLSLWLRSSGALDQFPLLVRESGAAATSSSPEAGDTLYRVQPTNDWTFVSFPWARRHADTTEVSVFLRGEVRAGASATIEFEAPRFTADRTRWSLASETEPFAHGPVAAHRFESPGQIVVRAASPSNEQDFATTVPSPEPTPRIDFSLASSLQLRADASATTSPWHPNLIQGAGFDSGTSPWRLAPNELGLGEASMAWDRGALRLSTSGPARDGAAWATQTVAVQPGDRYEFIAHAIDDRGIHQYGLVLQEADGTRHVINGTPSGALGTVLHTSFVPSSTSVEVQLRVLFDAGSVGSAWFDDITLRRALAYEWTLDGAPVDNQGPVAELSLGSRDHQIGLLVTDAFGESSSLSVEPPGRLAAEQAFELSLEQGPLVTTTLRGLKLPLAPISKEVDALATPRPWTGWYLQDGEAPGRATVDWTGTAARLDASPSPETSGYGLEKRIPTPKPGLAYDLTFQYRTTGGAAGVQAFIRPHEPGVLGYQEKRVNLTPSSEWTYGLVRGGVTSPTETQLLVALRGVFPAGAQGSVEFRNATLTPALSYAWGGANQTGPLSAVFRDTPGAVDWNVRAVTPGGLVLRLNGTVGVASPIRPFPSLEGAIGADWSASHFPPGVTIGFEGPVASDAPASAGQLRTPSFTPGEYVVVARSPGAPPVELGRRQITDLASVTLATPVAPVRGAEARFEFSLPNPHLAAVDLVIRKPTGGQEVVPLHLEDGAWAAGWQSRVTDFPGDLDLSLRLHDAQGQEASVQIESVMLQPAPGSTSGTLFTLILLSFAAFVVWRPERDGVRQKFVAAVMDAALVGIAFAVTALALSRSIEVGGREGVLTGLMLVAASAFFIRFTSPTPARLPGWAMGVTIALATSGVVLVILTSFRDADWLAALPRRLVLIYTLPAVVLLGLRAKFLEVRG